MFSDSAMLTTSKNNVWKRSRPSSNDNKSDQCNPTSTKYEGHQSGYTGTGTKPDLDNHSNQLNPNNQKKISGKGQGQANNDNKSDQCNPTSTKYEGHQSGYTGTGTKPDLDNYSNLLNPNNEKSYRNLSSLFHQKIEIGRTMSGKGQGQASNDNKSAQCNPTSTKYEGHQSGYTGTGTKPDLDNHSNQLNPNNQEYKGSK
ncbi:unnamed protein product [Mytilus coruscus]|uniref:Uncharacterized protein n=1 Tax=Mytilus coruscus TaxID=42192 RepID=A0A6J8D454_MYTCO|nr:unnamed protein product [Mytilus coruscus]